MSDGKTDLQKPSAPYLGRLQRMAAALHAQRFGKRNLQTEERAYRAKFRRFKGTARASLLLVAWAGRSPGAASADCSGTEHEKDRSPAQQE